MFLPARAAMLEQIVSVATGVMTVIRLLREQKTNYGPDPAPTPKFSQRGHFGQQELGHLEELGQKLFVDREDALVRHGVATLVAKREKA
jgi:hypothetical protein